MLAMLLIMIITLIMIGLLVGFTPYVMRRNIHFGVMLPEQANELPVTKKWKKQFFKWSIILTLGSVLPLFFGFFLNLNEESLIDYIAIVGTVMIFVLVIAQIIMYLHFHNQAKQLKKEQFSIDEIRRDARIMVSTGFRNQKMTVSNMWFIVLGGLIILVTILVPILMYDQIPDYIPRHWDGFENTDLWIPKSPRIFMLFPIVQFAMLLIFIFVNYTLKVTKQLIAPKNAKRSAQQNRAYRYAMSKLMIVIGVSTLALLAIPQFLMVFGVENDIRFLWPVVVYVIILLVGVVYTMLRYGQGGERYKPFDDINNDIDNEHHMLDDDEFWIWGMMYYNPNDPAVFVEKRFGIGTTVNLARWQTWAFAIGIFLFIGLTIIATVFLER